MIHPSSKKPLGWMLVSRSLLFLGFQVLVWIILLALGVQNAWTESARWWVFAVITANLVCIYFLNRLFKAEGQRFWDIFRFSKKTVWKDLLWFVLASVVGIPIMGLPMMYLPPLIFGDAMIPVNMMFQELPVWALVIGLLFPVTIALAELPLYYGYVMPRLSEQLKSGWVAWLICAFFLALQHIFLPLIFNGQFILYRFVLYLPFALFLGLVIKLRPSLLPYFVIVHALLDLATLSTYLMI